MLTELQKIINHLDNMRINAGNTVLKHHCAIVAIDLEKIMAYIAHYKLDKEASNENI